MAFTVEEGLNGLKPIHIYCGERRPQAGSSSIRTGLQGSLRVESPSTGTVAGRIIAFTLDRLLTPKAMVPCKIIHQWIAFSFAD